MAHGGTELPGYYIMVHSLNLTFHDSLLQMNYLQNIIIVHACFFTWLQMSLSVNIFLNLKFAQSAILKPYNA